MPNAPICSYACLLAAMAVSLAAAGPLPAQEPTLDQALTRVAADFAPFTARRTVAVFDLPDLQNRTNDLSRLLSESLTTEMVNAVPLGAKVIERRRVMQVLEEMGVTRVSLTLARLIAAGRQLGANAVVVGSSQVVGGRVFVNARLVSIPDGQILRAARFDGALSQDLLKLSASGVTTGEAGLGQPEAQPKATAGPAAAGERPNALRGQAGSLTLVITECRHKGAVVECSGTVACADDDMVTPTEFVMYDQRGVEHQISDFRLADRREKYTNLVSGVSTPLWVRFNDVPNDDSRASLIRAAFFAVKGGEAKFAFRSVPILR